MMLKKAFVFIAFCLLFGTLKAQQQDTALTEANKVFGLSYFWQEANYNYAYFENVPRLNWDSAYQAYIPKVLATKNRYEYYRQLQAFCALLHDGHTNVYFPADIQQKRVRRSFGPVKLELRRVDGRAVVVNVARQSKELIPLGSEILQVNRIPVKDYIDREVRPYVSQSADYILEDYCIDYLLEGFLGDSVHVRFRKPDGKTGELMLVRAVDASAEWLNPYENKLLSSRMLKDRTLYIALNSFDDPAIVDSFRLLLPRVKEARAVILDLRQNGGGSSSVGAAILSYFTDSSFIKGSSWATREHRASYKAWGVYTSREPGDSSDWARTSTDYFYGRKWYSGGQSIIANQAPEADRMPAKPLAVLLGHQTASAAEDFLIMLDGLKGRAITLGQNSFASTGQPLMFDLPGGGHARICTKKDTYPDGRIFVGKGIQPAVLVNHSYDDYLKNYDRTLEEALKALSAR
ncbi:MAG: S41 family peptidase [Chitinophagaceae bacterium]